MSSIRIIILVLVCLSSCQSVKQDNTGFEIQPSGFSEADIDTESHFRGISVVDSLVIWVSGSNGTVLRTVDGGRSWDVISVPGFAAYDFRDIEAFDDLTAIIMSAGRPAILLKTQDGGENWETGYSDDREGIFLNSMSFWNETFGIVVGDPIEDQFFILTTSDGGEEWAEMDRSKRPEAFRGEYQFAASGTAITVAGENHTWFGTGGTRARIFYSHDRGQSWKESDVPLTSGVPSAGVFSLFFSDEQNGWAVGGDYTREDSIDLNSCFTRDGGITWQLSEDLPNGFRSCVLQIRPGGYEIMICTGPSGTDYSLNNGMDWVSLESPGYHTMDVGKDGLTVWAAGANGRVGKLEYTVVKGGSPGS
jgi:photosystem II stability/assembly factor-like uncharacterized protein